MTEENKGSNKYGFYLQGNKGRALLLIHGITGTPSEMHYIGKDLHKAGYSVLCNALPRHCSSLSELRRVTWKEIEAACKEDFLRLKAEHDRVFVAGLSMGALMATHLAYLFPAQVSAVVALAPTFFYDGWALHKGKIFLNIFWHIPFLRDTLDIRETWPYGIKNEGIREAIERFYKNAQPGDFDDKNVMFGSPFFPLACLYQHHLFVQRVKKELPMVRNPLLVIHAQEDDMVSLRNAHYLYENIGASGSSKRMKILGDSYHMITVDQEKYKVSEHMVTFLNEY